jgi:hypothetical protein
MMSMHRSLGERNDEVWLGDRSLDLTVGKVRAQDSRLARSNVMAEYKRDYVSTSTPDSPPFEHPAVHDYLFSPMALHRNQLLEMPPQPTAPRRGPRRSSALCVCPRRSALGITCLLMPIRAQ